jgi:thymidylate synthase
MRYFTLLFVLLCLPLISQAEKGQSIMFGDQDPLYVKRTRDTTADEQAEHCTQLRQRMNELKGRPQSRNAVIRRYRVECKPGHEMPGQSRLQ